MDPNSENILDTLIREGVRTERNIRAEQARMWNRASGGRIDETDLLRSLTAVKRKGKA